MKMEKKKIWKSILIPVLTIMAIGACAFGLWLAIKTDQTALTGDNIVSVQTNQAGAARAKWGPSVSTEGGTIPTNTAPPTYEAIEGTEYNLYKAFIPGKPGPSAKDIGYMQAGLTAVKALETLFKEDLKQSGMEADVEYDKSEHNAKGTYNVSIMKKSRTELSYLCGLDSVSGKIFSMHKMAFPDAKGETTPDEGDDKLMDAADHDPMLKEMAEKIVNDNYADGRTIKEVMIDGVQWVGDSRPYDVLVDCKVHMSEGECYTISLGYPGYAIDRIYIYPLGWPSCVYGYQDPNEAGNYPPLETNTTYTVNFSPGK